LLGAETGLSLAKLKGTRMRLKELAALTLVVSLTVGSLPAQAQDTGAVVDRAALDQALAKRAQSDETDRDAIRTLLRRDDVKAMVGGMGVDVKRAESAVASLDGRELQDAALQARAANDLLVGGAHTIQISVVTLLLIIIIIILLAD
jgi:hypothetical protein